MKLLSLIAFVYIFIEYLNYLKRKENNNLELHDRKQSADGDSGLSVDMLMERSNFKERQTNTGLESETILIPISENIETTIDKKFNSIEAPHTKSNELKHTYLDSVKSPLDVTQWSSKKDQQKEFKEANQNNVDSDIGSLGESYEEDVHCYIDEEEVPLKQCDLEKKGLLIEELTNSESAEKFETDLENEENL